MKTSKKIRKAIAKKFKSWNGTTTAKEAVIEESWTSNIPEEVEVKEITNADKATAQLCKNINENSDDLNISQPTCEPSEKVQNAPTETPSASNDLPSDEIEPRNAVKEKPSIKIAQQRQAILAGFIGTALLVASVALCILEMHVIAVIGGIVGLACVSFALYSVLKPNTKLEEVENIEQIIVQASLNPA